MTQTTDFIQDFELGGGGGGGGGGEQEGSRMILVCMATRGIWGHIMLNLDCF